MIDKDDIIIRKSILHVLDTVHGDCILSNQLLNPGEELYDFMRSHIFKLVNSDDAKHCYFDPEISPLYEPLKDWDETDEESFISLSQFCAEKLYQAMADGLDIPAADLLFVTFQAHSEIYLAMLKINYKDTYTHKIVTQGTTDTESDPIISASIVKSHGLFPSAGSRLPEAVIIRLSDLDIRLLEKKYEINGEKVFYLSENFLVCRADLPAKKKLNLLTKVITNITNKYDDADAKVKMDTKSALQKEYQDKKEFDIEEIGQTLFGNHPAKKAEFDEKMEQLDLQFDKFTVENESTVKKLEKQVVTTDSGIEISIPMEIYNTLSQFEISTDYLGKTTIVIKDIDNLIIK